MAVSGTIESYFVAWTPHGMIIDEIYFDNEFWFSMKNKFQKYYENFVFKALLSMGRAMILSRYFKYQNFGSINILHFCKLNMKSDLLVLKV